MLKFLQRLTGRMNAFLPELSGPGRAAGRRRRLGFHRNQRFGCEALETRVLPAIAGFQITSADSPNFDRYVTNMTWNDDAVTANTTYEVWVDQVVSSGNRNSRVLYADDIPATGGQISFQPDQDFVTGNYIAWVRKHDPLPSGPWVRTDFQIDNDGNPNTPLPAADTPDQSVIGVIRPGQGYSGHTLTESRIGWSGDEALYDVWVNKRNASGGWTPYSLIRNVPTRTVSYRELAEAASGNTWQFFGEIDQNSRAQLETGDYRIFVRGVNDAVNASGQWAGRGPWSSGVDFSFRQIEGADAVPKNLTATSALRPTVSWDAVDGAEAYMIWFSSAGKPSITLRVNGTSYTPAEPVLRDQNNSAAISPGDQWDVRVRALGADGSSLGFAHGNFASVSLTVPTTLTSQNFSAPAITGPSHRSSDQTPVLRWEQVDNAVTYEVWFSSLQTQSRAFLASGMTQNTLHLDPDILLQYVSESINPNVYSTDTGLAEGDYRFWVRAHAANGTMTGWSTAYRFTVDRSLTMSVNLRGTGEVAGQPIVSARHIVPYEQDGRQFVLLTNGRGETFGSSVVARYEVGADGVPFRPVVTLPGGATELEFPDLDAGANNGGLKVLPNGKVVVLSRGSGELRVINPETWQIESTLQMLDIANGEFHDAINMTVLDNGQVLVVFNRFDKLRVFDVDDVTSAITEVSVASATGLPGFDLPLGRGVEVQGMALPDGTYRLFMATPSLHGITIHHYDPVQKTLTAYQDGSGDAIVITRNEFAFPFLGGLIQTVNGPGGSEQSFYFSADRAGFVTWVNTETFQHGYIDMADLIPSVSRDPSAAGYADPTDNTFDATRIIRVDDDHIAVFNNRQESVVMKLALEPGGGLSVAESATLFQEYGGAIVSVESGLKLLATSDSITVYDLLPDAGTQSLTVGEGRVVPLGVAVVESKTLGDDLVIKYNGGLRAIVRVTGDGTGLEEITLPKRYTTTAGDTFVLDNGATAVYENPVTKQRFIMMTGHPLHTTGPDSDRLVVLDVTNPHNSVIQAVHDIGAMALVHSATATADEIVVMNRRGGKMLTISNWQTPTAAITSVYDFHEARVYELGRTRPAEPLIMPDGTLAIMHDTTPDRGVSVFDPGTATQTNRFSTFHALNTGSFAFELEYFDPDRIISVNYNGDVVILNIRTGVIESDQRLANLGGTDANVAAAQNQSFHNGILVVNTPSTETVSVFQVRNDGSVDPATPLRVFEIEGVFGTEVDDTGYWIIKFGEVLRVAL
ncbi:MAG: hypothetical protein R3C59_14000 [Planctomycetaceae bacterium]